MSSQTKIMDEVNMWIREGFKTHLPGSERASWEAVFVVQQTPDGNIVPLVVLYTQIPAAQIGSAHMNIAQLSVLGLTIEAVVSSVKNVLDSLWEHRTAELTQTNGHGSPPGKLVLP